MSDISDSDEEERRSLDVSLISRQILQRKLSHLPNRKRQALENALGRFNTSTPLDVLAEEDEVVEDSDKEALMEVEHIHSGTSPKPLETVPIHFENEENAGHLQAYINSKYLTFVSERSLRKRNFASTHPYLSDQASYLGLADAHELNSVYEENGQNLEAVVKLLNYNYLRLKSKYPKDEKFKQKSFYAIIGKQSKEAQQEEQQKERGSVGSGFNGDVEFTNEMNPSTPTLDQHLESSQLLDDVAYDVNNYESEADIDLDTELYSSSDEENEKENLYVRVGGRYRKEKNALKGILPESAEHLPIYQAKFSRLVQKAKPQRAFKRGVAIKKIGSRNRSFRLHDDFEDTFLNDDDAEYVSPENYVTNDLLAEQHDLSQSRETTLFHDSDISASSTSETESDSDLDLFSFNDDERYALQNTNDVLGEALENDVIDRMLTSTAHSRLGRIKLTPKIKPGSRGYPYDIGRQNGTHVTSKNSARRSITRTARRKSSLGHARKQHDENITWTARSGYNTIDNFASSIDERSSMNVAEHSLGDVAENERAPTARVASFQRQAKPKSFTKALFTGTRKLIKKKEKNCVANQGLIESYFGPSTIGSRSRGDRAPLLASVDIEAESREQGFYQLRKRPKVFNHYSNDQLQLSHEPTFAPGCLLNDIELMKLGNTGDGKTFHRFEDPISVVFEEKHFQLSLLDIDGSRELADQLCLLLNSEIVRGTIRKRDFYHCVGALIAWTLILQRSPSESDWSWVNTMVASLRDSSVMKQSDKFFCLPYMVLLQYSMLIMGLINEGVSRRQNMAVYGVSYWSWFFSMAESVQFEMLDFRGGSANKQAESFYVMCRLLELQGVWWSSICMSVQSYNRYNFYDLLESVFYLCCITRKQATWEPLQLVFQKFNDTTDLGLYYRYIEIVFSMNRMRNWKIDDKLILQVYGNITSRRFANFPDEDYFLCVLSQVRSRFDIPGDSFFNRFLQLLFWHISSLTDGSQVKRLVTKLLSFNTTQYSNSKEQRAMFCNKFNLLILLSLISKTNLRTQVEILISSLNDITDLSFLNQAVEGISVVFEIALSKGARLPTEGVDIMTSKLASMAFSTPGVLKLWKKFLRFLRSRIEKSQVEPPSLIQMLLLIKQMKVELPIKLNIDIAGIGMSIGEQLLALKGKLRNPLVMKSLNTVKEKSLDTASSYMHRLANGNEFSEMSDKLICDCITIWILVSHLLDENGDKLVLQTYPFIGNELVRGRYVFHFYMEVSRFYNLNNCKQSVVVNVIQGLASFKTPLRLFEFIDRLSGLGWVLFSFHRLRNVPDNDMISTKFGILNNMLNRSSTCDSPSELNMMVYEVLKSIKRESNNCSNAAYKDSCITLFKEMTFYTLDNRNGALLTEIRSLLGVEAEVVNNAHQLHHDFNDGLELDDEFNLGEHEPHVLASMEECNSRLRGLMEMEDKSEVGKWKSIYKILFKYNLAIFRHRSQFSTKTFMEVFNIFKNALDDESTFGEAEEYKVRAFSQICAILGSTRHVLFEGYWVPSDLEFMFKEFEQKLRKAFPFVATSIPSESSVDGGKLDPEQELIQVFRQTFSGYTTTTDEVYTKFDLEF